MDQICDSCGAISWRDKEPEWCCDKGKTEVRALETHVNQEDEDDTNDINRDDDDTNEEGRQDGNEGVETSTNAPINPDEADINRILHSMRPGTSTLTDDCKEYCRYSVQYNNAASMTSQQVTINYAVALYTCKVQGAITTHMSALASVFGQIYIMDSTQDQSITRSVHIPVIPVVF